MCCAEPRARYTAPMLENVKERAKTGVRRVRENEILREFKEFALKGSVIDLAVGIMVGGAFNKIVTSLVNDVIMPPIGVIVGKMDFSNLFLDLSGKHPRTLARAKAAGDATINYGVFINNILDFLIVAFIIFLVVRQINHWRRNRTEGAEPTSKNCPYCLSVIPIQATRCPHCTSALRTSAGGSA